MSTQEHTPRPSPKPTATSEDAGNAPHTSTWVPLRALVLRLHFYAGILVAPFVVVAAVTGLLYAYTPQLEQWMYADQLRVVDRGQPIPVSMRVDAAVAAHPEGTLSAVRIGGPEDSTRVLFDVDGLPESVRSGVFVDPYTGEVLGTLEVYGSSGALPVRTWISMLHRHLHLGDVGRLYSELAASWLWVVALGGVVLWVGRGRAGARVRRVLLPEKGAAGRRRTMSWHGSVGVWVLLGVLAFSATGLTWSAYAGQHIGDIRRAMGWQTPSLSAEIFEEGHHGESGEAAAGGHEHHHLAVGVDQVVGEAREAGIDGPVEVTYPVSETQAYKVAETGREWPVQQDSALVDPMTGEVVETLRFADYPLMAKLTTWGIAAHMGLLFGLPNQLALTVLVLALLTLVAWGYRMWWQRRPTAREGFAMGRPFPRGTWRRLPLWAKIAVVAAAVGLGWLMPVWAVSLAGFLVVDLFVARST
ncbi:PepSY domain-containing protein [Thermobifida halotolerans]|uniref:PepSY domain-containing protein n=1 Tax=Thermobifida halotolerans TaxID=483545 RepID=A0A399G0V9_9ACTN|nr:PepSY domain-containing protein [Thermobifida halotolerans]UOE18702.1 PepSY domain-containing protein [Thermobifida halotolerans]